MKRIFVGWMLAAAVLGVAGVEKTAWAQSGATRGTQVVQLDGGSMAAVRVEGTERIEEATVRSYLQVAPGQAFDQGKLDESVKALFGTGLFADVALRREGNVLVVKVVENPIINRIAFEGNRRVKEEQLKSEVQLRPRVVYTRTRVQSDVQRIVDLYRRNGRFAAKVEPKIIKLEQNRVDLVFEIDEGPRTDVSGITFVGNEKFSDSSLRSVVQTKESRWYRFLSSDDTYDPDRMNYDKELLRRYYLSEGYADFRVVSAVAELTPEKDAFYITFTLDEGERYHFGKIDVTTNLKGLDVALLRDALGTDEGDWYDATAVEKTIDALTTVANERQFPFVDVRPRINRNREALTVDVTFEVNEGPRVYVERIDITGNVRTLDKVVRREFQLAEGDPFNAAKLKRSEQRVRDLGFFEKVNVNTVEGSAPDRQVVQVDVAEQSTGEISFGAGFSTTDGALGDFSIRERNLLGRGQDLRLGALLSMRRQEYDVSFTEPYFLDREMAAGVDIFRITRDNQKYSSYDEQSTGGGLRLGYPLTENLRQKVSFAVSQTSITNVPDTASRYIKEQSGSRTLSAVSQELYYDRRNSKTEPTRGYYVRVSNDVAGAGGDTKFLRTRVGAGFYYPVIDQVTLQLTGEVGHIFGIGQNVRIMDRFFLGGDTLRGFRTAGVGPRDVATGDALGGNQFARGSVQVSFPLGLPEEFGVSGRVFTDFGTLRRVEVTDPNVRDNGGLRASSGFGIGWKSPMGPIGVDIAMPMAKQDYDKTEQFRFSFGTRF